MEKFGARPKNRKFGNRTCRFCNAPNWTPLHKCPALDANCNKCGKKGHYAKLCRQKMNNNRTVKRLTENEPNESDEPSSESEDSIHQNRIQTAISGTESTIKTDTGKIINRKFISDPLFQTERKIRKEPALHTTGEINPKNRHCIRGLDGKYTRWDEILKDILNGKLKIVPNKKRADSDTEKTMTTKTKKCRKKSEHQ